jgi:hypothetical protein
MIRQFLLLPDGSVPKGADIDVIRAAGIPIVMPTERGVPSEGMMFVEAEPVEDSNGVLRQTWIEVPAPVPEPVQE